MNAEAQKFQIFVNRDSHEINTHTITYDRVVELYLGQGGPALPQYVVRYSHGPAANPDGLLAPGGEVKVKDGMRFRVSGTGES
jgi:hypothetical protein